MLIAWAVPCGSYEWRADGTIDIFSAGFDTFHVEHLPAEIELFLVVRLVLLEDERAELELHVLGPAPTSAIRSLVHEIEAEPGPTHRAGYDVNQTEVLELHFPATTEGVYSVELYTDGVRRLSASVSMPRPYRQEALTVRER